MPKITPEIKSQITALSKAELEKIVVKLAGKDKGVFDYLLVNYLEMETGEAELFEQAKIEIDSLFKKSYKGYTDQLRLANMLSACTKRINEFSKICKNKTLEIDLLMHVLEAIFSETTNLFGTCFTTFDYKVGVMVKRAITLIQTKIHPDYKIEYSSKINNYLNVLHRTANHIDTIYGMPEAI